jgi:hypothetical protein
MLQTLIASSETGGRRPATGNRQSGAHARDPEAMAAPLVEAAHRQSGAHARDPEEMPSPPLKPAGEEARSQPVGVEPAPVPNPLPWVLVALLVMAVLGLVAYIVVR